MVYHRI
jgi:hypothetical protein